MQVMFITMYRLYPCVKKKLLIFSRVFQWQFYLIICACVMFAYFAYLLVNGDCNEVKFS